MDVATELTRDEKKLIRELAQAIAEVDSEHKKIDEDFFNELACYVEGIKTGLKFQNNVSNNF